MSSRDKQVLQVVKRFPGHGWERIRSEYMISTGRVIAEIALVAALSRLRRAGHVSLEPRVRMSSAYRATA